MKNYFLILKWPILNCCDLCFLNFKVLVFLLEFRYSSPIWDVLMCCLSFWGFKLVCGLFSVFSMFPYFLAPRIDHAFCLCLACRLPSIFKSSIFKKCSLTDCYMYICLGLLCCSVIKFWVLLDSIIAFCKLHLL